MNDACDETLVNAVEFESNPEAMNGLLGSINSSIPHCQVNEEEKLRQKLRFFYMNPIEKWQNKQRFPYKFCVQLIKIIVVTLQSCMFAYHHTAYVEFVFSNKVAFSHLFLQGWDSSREIISYPPQSGDLAIYKSSDFYSAIDFAVINYADLENAVGSYTYAEENNNMAPMEFCLYHYKICDIFGFNESYVFNNEVLKTCITINITKSSAKNFSSKQYFQHKNLKIQFSAFVQGHLSFLVKTVNLRPAGPKACPDCFQFNVTVGFDNTAHNGKIKTFLDIDIFRLHCKGNVDYRTHTQLESLLHTFLNCTVILLCLISCILCSRAVYRALMLRRKTVKFFKNNYNKVLSSREQLEFINLWYLTMIISDFLIIIGSSLKEKIESNEFTGDEWNICSILLGLGTFLIWFCVIRYMGFFKAYNVIIMTLKVATPMILRFMVCTIMIYAGFTVCGWIVLGPYHNKFRTLSVTLECLFALINGDDVFGTFNTLEPTKSLLIWWFSRIYLYFFISLFIYVIISLFVSVILDAYETIKHYYNEGFPKSEIQEFIDKGFQYSFVSESSSLADDFPHCFPSTLGFMEFISSICSLAIFERHKHNTLST